jgi:hypothetical protein
VTAPDRPSIPIPFAIGETAWWVGHRTRCEKVQCPECCGALALSLRLGNGETYSVECAACRLGYDPPSGLVTVERAGHEPREFTCDRVELYSGTLRYQWDTGNGFYSATPDDLFATREECAAECERRNVKLRADLLERDTMNIAFHRSKVAWSAHYWRSAIVRLERELALARDRLAACPKPRKKAATEEPR